MKIAYLILAHSHSEQLKRLIDRLNSDDADFYIHLDKKSQIFTETYEHLKTYKNAHLYSEYNVYWMGYNMVLATLMLLKKAFCSNSTYKYYVLLSGQDYPIKSKNYIESFFANNSCDFLDWNNVDHLTQPIRDKVEYYHYLDTKLYNPRDPNHIKRLVWLYFGGQKHLNKILPKRSFYNNMNPFFGPQWFGMTHKTVKYILNFLDNNKGYERFMKFTAGPDETFFQTIVLNSDRKTNLYNYDGYLKWLECRKDGDIFINDMGSLHFMDWSEKLIEKPAVLTMEYYEELINSDFLFARKFDPIRSKELLDNLDDTLLNKTAS